MTHHHHRALLQRINNGPGVREAYCIRPGRHRGRFKWIEPDEVPVFVGRTACVEVDLIGGKWTILGLAP